MNGSAANYAPLWCKSNYSFLEGASHPDELVEEAHRLGIRSLALTDRDGVYGMVRAHKRAQELGIHLIVGAQITLCDDSLILLLSETREGYANLCRLISAGRLRSEKGSCHVSLTEVCEHAGGLMALWGGNRSLLVAQKAPDAEARQLKEAFADRVYALLTRQREDDDARRERILRERAKRYEMPTLAGMEVLYHTRARRPLQDILSCIQQGITLPAAGCRIRSNAEHALMAPRGFEQLYGDDTHSIFRTGEISERCNFSLSQIRYRYPSERLADGMTSTEWLRQLTDAGARKRYPGGIPGSVRDQIARELHLIAELDYGGYFLTMHEIVTYCRQSNILCQGRGSAANSTVCYCLGITAVDPIRMGLLFERFISRERAEPPDIDLDIEHDRREEVIQHVYRKYGRTHAAMVANFIRYRARSAVRDVGKALGFPETTIERFSRVLSHYDSLTEDSLQEAGFDPRNRWHDHLLKLSIEIQDTPRHLSIHPGGFLLGHEPVHDLVPIENATMPERTVIQWDKEDLEDLGLFKVDLLGLGALNVVHRAFDLIEFHGGESLSLATIPPQDEPTFEMIRKADTVGTFQIESRAQMSMLPRLKPRNYYDLVIEISIVRPGPITGGMVHPYLRRRNGEEVVDYPHPTLEPVLKKTLGIPLFQEQVMQLAMVAADYTPGEADQLRRDMAAWRKTGRIERHRERLITRMMDKGITEAFAERVFDQIRGFGDYGFPESHAASFALIAYATAWLKCHHPAVYLCAMLNAQPMGFYSAATLVEDGKRHGIVIAPVNVQHSHWDCTLERAQGGAEEFAVRMGLRYVKGLHAEGGERITSRRPDGGYASIEAFAAATRLDDFALSRLAQAGAFEGFQEERRDALWTVLGIQKPQGADLKLEIKEQDAHFEPLDTFETIHWDYEVTSHSPRGHPLTPLREELSRQGCPDAATVRAMKNGERVRYAGMVICRQRPGTAKGVVFMTLEDETGFVNLVMWERAYQQHRLIAKTAIFLGVSGKLQTDSNTVHIVVDKLWIPQVGAQPVKRKSRDFH
ncbi:MAG: error-prone DNA polymerase [Verrucomicrobia bacterium]|nr:error-prone DNA polymerase [Verrucomicrobiota bacterium]